MTSRYPFPPQRSLATRLITMVFLLGALALLSVPLWRPLLSDAEPSRGETVASSVTLEQILAAAGAGQPLAELSPAARSIARDMQVHADALATDGGVSSLWRHPDDLPAGVVVEVLSFCQNDVTILCTSPPWTARSVTACRERPKSEDVVVHSASGDWWAVLIACTRSE